MTQSHRWLIKWARTLHVYLTLFGFALLFFFAVTGFMLNHEDWFLPQQTTSGTIPIGLCTPDKRDDLIEHLRGEFAVPGDLESFESIEGESAFQLTFNAEDAESGKVVKTDVVIYQADGRTVCRQNRASEHVTITEGKLPVELLVPDDRSKDLLIVEKLRKDFGLRGAVNGPPHFEKETESMSVQFKGPSYEANVRIKIADGETRISQRSRGLAGLMLDLHRGKDSGMEWSVIIDALAILMVVVSITGFILWTSLKSRAHYGLWILLAGTVFGFVVYFVYVPR